MSANRPPAGLPAWPARTPDEIPPAVANAVAAMRAGTVVLLPTEGVHALAADPRRPEALAILRTIKGREDGSKALLLLAADLDQARAVARFDARALSLAAAWPAPLTLVLPPVDAKLAKALGASGLAVRVPAHPVARLVARSLGFPVTGTSANRAGEPPVVDVEGAAVAFDRADVVAGRLAGIVDVGRLPGGPPSTLVDLTGAPHLVREGAFARAILESILGIPLAPAR